MKVKYIILVLFLVCSSLSFAQNKLFEKYAETDNVTSVYISKAMFQMMPGMKTGDLNLMNMKDKIDGLQILSTEHTDLKKKMKKDFSMLVNDQHQELMRVKDGKTRVTFYIKMKGNQVNELIMLADTDEEYSVIRLQGNFTLQDIQEISKGIR